jgi:hypothetical protein
MKEKILTALKTKYKNLGLSDKALLGVAAMLALTTTEEANIETAISAPEVDEMLKGVQSYGDGRATQERDKLKPPVPPVEPPADPTKPNPDDAQKPDWQKAIEALTTNVTALTTELAGIKAGKAAESRLQQLTSKLDKTPEAFKKTILDAFEYMSFKDDEAFNSYLEKVGTQANDAIQDDNNDELAGIKAPVFGQPNKDGVSAGTQAYIDAKKADATASPAAFVGKKV